jgi:hypothetical protein
MSGYPCSWAVLHVVPHPHTGRGSPVGIVLQSRPAQYVGCRAITDADRLRELAPDVDIELLVRYLRSCEAIAEGREEAGEIALLSAPERYYWLTAPRSDVLQPGRPEYGMSDDPARLLDTLWRWRHGERRNTPCRAGRTAGPGAVPS